MADREVELKIVAKNAAQAAIKAVEQDLLGLGRAGTSSGQAITRGLATSLADVNRLTSQFSGAKVITDANNIAAAVTRIGGVSKLTTAEQANLNRQVTEAIAKYRALGATAPPELQALAKETAGAARATSSLGTAFGAVRTILPMLGITSVAASLTGLATSAIKSAGNLIDLSNKTGLSTDALQEMQQVANQTGTSLDAFTNSTFKLGVNVAEGTKKARDAVRDLGLAYDELKAQKPEDQFSTVMRALEGVDNQQERNRLGVALFGKQFSEIAASVAEGYSDIAAAGQKSSREQLEALDQIGDAWQQLVDDISKGAQRTLGVAAQALIAIERGADSLSNTQKAGMMVSTLWGKNYLGELQRIGQELIEAEKKQKALNAAQQGGPVTPATAPRNFARELAEARQELAEFSKNRGGVEQLTAAIALGGDAAKEYAESISLSDAALRLFQSSAKDGAKASNERTKELEAEKKAQDALFGRDLITRGNEYARLLGDVGNVAKLAADKKAELRAATVAALDAYKRLGLEAPQALREIEAATRPLLVSTRQWAHVELKAAAANLTPFAASVRSLSVESVPLLSASIHSSRLGFVALRAAVKDTREGLAQAHEKTIKFDDSLTALAQSLGNLANVAGGTFGGIVQWLSTVVAAVNVASKATDQMQAGLIQMRGKDATAGDKFSGALGVAAGAVGAGAALWQATGQGNTAQRTLGGAMTGLKTGAGIGAMFGGPAGAALGAGIGAVSGAVLGLVRGFGRIPEEVKKARQEVDNFQKGLAQTLTAQQKAAAGGEQWKATVIRVTDAYTRTGRTAAEAEAIVRQLWDTNNPERARAAMAEINAVLEEQAALLERQKKEAAGLFDEIMAAADAAGGQIPESFQPVIDQFIELGLLTDDQAAKLRGLATGTAPSLKQMEDALSAIGGRVETLGPLYRQQKLDETSKKYLNAISTLMRGTSDIGAVLFDAREELSELAVEALKTGGTLPAQFKPWVEELARAGLLVDENGDKITDLSRLKFGEAMKTDAELAAEAFANVTGEIRRLVDEIVNRLGPAISGIPTPNLAGTAGGDTSVAPITPEPGFSRGTMGTFGRWFHDFDPKGERVRLHGREAVVPEDDAMKFALDMIERHGGLPPTNVVPPSSGRVPLAEDVHDRGASAGGGNRIVTTHNNVPVFVISAGDNRPLSDRVGEIQQHLAEHGISGNDFGLREVLEDIARDVVRREKVRG